VLAAADDDGVLYEDPNEPSALPGTRAPHVVVERAGVSISTLDLLGRSFVLVAGPDGVAWCRAARQAGDDLGVPVDAYRIGGDLDDSAGRCGELYRTGSDGAVLIRPDGFIAWRAPTAEQDPERVLAGALAHVLARST
jgi:putative polyketide hydroxylase